MFPFQLSLSLTLHDNEYRCHVVLEGFGSMWAEVLLLVLAAALIVASMVIGLVIAKLETGRISVTAAGKEVT